ncbi:MAG: glycosyltransferase [bacterium]|nr:glycosyltransferase [bacterium]
MRILVVCDVLGEENNGTTVATMNLIRFLKSQNHEVRVLCCDKTKMGKEGYYIAPVLNFGILNKYVENAGVELAKADKRVIMQALDGVDHVHIMLPFSLGTHVAKIAYKRGLPITAGFHMQAENFTAYLKLNRLKCLNHLVYKVIWKKLYRYVDGIHYPTEFIKDTFERHIKRKTNAYVISNGINEMMQVKKVEKKPEYKDKILILSVGRLEREKSQDVLIKAAALSKYKDKIQIILAGKGHKEKYYKKLGEKLPNRPIFAFYSRQELVDILNSADLYIHPADIELEGIACLEAIGCGKLVIVSDSKLSATRYFAVDDRCIFKTRDPKDLARVIDYWLDNKEEKAKVEKKYLESSKTNSLTYCMQMMEKMMVEVSNAKKGQK